MIAYRAQDQADIVALLATISGAIDLDFLRGEWSIFADTEPARTAWLETQIARIIPAS